MFYKLISAENLQKIYIYIYLYRSVKLRFLRRIKNRAELKQFRWQSFYELWNVSRIDN